MKEWVMKPSYKFDLACFCNLYSQEEMGIERHQDVYNHFKNQIEARQDLITFAKNLLSQGILVGCVMVPILDLLDYNEGDIDSICQIFEDKSCIPLIEAYAKEQEASKEMYEMMLAIFPMLAELLRYTHSQGLYSYWIEHCLPSIETKCQAFEAVCDAYPVVSEVNSLLGFEQVKQNYVTLYLCHFSAPYGIGGLKHAFVSDVRWDFKGTVAIAVHEMMHPPFSREKIKEITPTLWADEFFKEAKSRLSPSSGYHLPEAFVEENLVEGAHIYLSELLGVQDNPLDYFLQHDSGSHVLSVILYDALKRGYREQLPTIEAVVERLIADGTLKPGNMAKQYKKIYDAVNKD